MHKLVTKGLLTRCLCPAIVPPSTVNPVQPNPHHVSRRTLIFSIKTGIDRDFLSKMQQPIDLSPESITRWLTKRKLEEERFQQRYQEERHKKLGPDLATAHFILGRKGRVKFVGDDRWIRMENDKILLPNVFVPNMKLEAVDASSTLLTYEGLDNFVDLASLKYLDLSGCPLIDDWCVNKLEKFQDSLLYLDISSCPRVTVRGLSSLHHLKNLRRLKLDNMTGVPNMSLVTFLLEEMLPDCYIEGMHFTDADKLMESVNKELNEPSEDGQEHVQS